MKKRFCPVCGATDKSFVQGVCVDCFLKKNRVLEYPGQIKVLVCRECGKILVKGKWVAPSDERLLDLAVRSIQTKSLSDVELPLERVQERNGSWGVSGTASGKLGDEKISIPVELLMSPSESLCRECGLMSADYYEAKIQFRFSSKKKVDWEPVLSEFESRLEQLFANDSLARISKTASVAGGVDVWIGSKHAAKTIVNELAKKQGLSPVVTSTLAGVDKSGRVKKTFTFLVRFKQEGL